MQHVDPVGLIASQDAVGHALEFGKAAAGVGNLARTLALVVALALALALALGQLSEDLQCREVAPRRPLREG